MSTLQSVRADARVLLQDTDTGAFRYSDTDLLGYVNDGLAEAYTLRPDLFFGTIDYELGLERMPAGDPLPISEKYRATLADYVVFRAHAREDETSSGSRAAAFYQRFRAAFAK
jgi:hypothetical protein